MNVLSLDEITDRIVEAVLQEPFINKKELTPVIRATLKIWIIQLERAKGFSKSDGKLAAQFTIIETERDFWKNKARELFSESKLQEAYDELDVVREKM